MVQFRIASDINNTIMNYVFQWTDMTFLFFIHVCFIFAFYRSLNHTDWHYTGSTFLALTRYSEFIRVGIILAKQIFSDVAYIYIYKARHVNVWNVEIKRSAPLLFLIGYTSESSHKNDQGIITWHNCTISHQVWFPLSQLLSILASVWQ